MTVQVIEILSQFKYMLAVTWPYTDRKGLTFTLDQYNSSMQIIFPFKGRDLGYLKDVEEIQKKIKNQTVAVKQSYCLDCDGNETAVLENNWKSSVI